MSNYEKMNNYINYHNEIKVKKSTTKLVGAVAAFIIILMIFIHFKILAGTSAKKVDKLNTTNSSKTVTKVHKTSKSSKYILQDSDKYKVTDVQLKRLTGYELMMARNEIFARHGYVFKKEPFKSYFEAKSWYTPNPSFKGYDSQLSSVEKYNIKQILKYENMK
ncbi:YARHG domain-containing protein [Clostridium guangxiense]|uniref:YARHG domain-containing protein n=1 Tax=Clostridium guangxiense TaxID=1662055 RepID=UPI001E521032|nr:YARHG domain-containing protein [Clostridium guangxiense]